MDKKSILIVGASSLLGKSFCKFFGSHYDIFTCGRNSINDSLKHIEMDLSKELHINELPKKIDIVLYLAQSYKFRDFPNSSDEIFKINTSNILEFLNYSKNIGIKQFIYASTGSVYTEEKIHTENELIDNNKLNGFYATSKFCGELLVNNYKEFFNTVILRPFFMFGENQKKDMMVPRLISNIKNNIPVQLQGEDGIKINPIYVEDAAKILEKIIKDNLSGIFNIAGEEVISFKKLCQIIGNTLKTKPIFEYQNIKPKNIIADTSKVNFQDYTKYDLAIEKLVKNV